MADQPNIAPGLLEIINEALDRPIAFHRVFVKLTGSVTAALMLSQAMYWSKRTSSKDKGQDWFFKTIEQWEEETGLTRREQEVARKKLRAFSFWKEQLQGVPARMYYRVDITELSKALMVLSEPSNGENNLNKNASLHKSAKLVCTKAPSKYGGNVQTSMAETAKHNKGVSETTTEIIKTTTPLTPLEPGVEPPGSGRGFFEQILSGTLFVSADPVRISRAAAKYGRAADYVALAVDVLDQQYRQSKRGIDDVTALIVATLKDGIDPPEGYVPRVQREAAAAVKREEACTRVQEEQAGKQAFAEAEMLLLAMPDGEREKIFDEARAKIHKKFRTSSVAVRSMAVEILMQRARAPGTV